MGLSGTGAASGALSGAAAGSVIPGLGTVAGGVIGGLAGLFSGGDDTSAADRQAAIDAIKSVGEVPNLSDPIALQHYVDAGVLSPTLVQRLNLNADKATTLTENPADRNNQAMTLAALQQMSQNGMSAADMAQFNQMRNQVGADTQAKTAQLLQQAQMRGQLGGGDTLAAQLSANQNGATNEASQANQQAIAAAQARAQALNSFGSLSGQVRSQDYNTQQFNTQNDILRQQFLDQNATARQNANVGATNNANLYNTQRSQSVSDANTAAGNAELARQRAAEAQAYQLKLQAAQSQASVYMGSQKYDQAQQAANAQGTANIMSGVGQLASTLSKKPATPGTPDPASTTDVSGVKRPGGTVTP
jgi:hypothetical protein